MNKFLGLHVDFLGFVTSFICAVHCTAVPVIFSLGLMGTHGMSHNHLFDVTLVLAGISFAAYSILKDYKKFRNTTPLLVALAGISFLIYGLNGHTFTHNISSIIGGISLALSHYINWYSNHKKCAVS